MTSDDLGYGLIFGPRSDGCWGPGPNQSLNITALQTQMRLSHTTAKLMTAEIEATSNI